MTKTAVEATANPFSPGNLPQGHTQGIAARSKYRIVAPVHIVVPSGSGYLTWCTAAPAMAETALGKPCRVCTALLREYHEECGEPQ
jgi:hypothetical protein